MGGRVTKDPGLGTVVELSTAEGQPPLAEQLADLEVVAAVAGDAVAIEAAVEALAEAAVADEGTADERAEAVAAGIDAAIGAAPPDEDDEALEPLYLDRHKSPTKAVLVWAAEQLRDRMETIEGTIIDDGGANWNGVKVVPWADVIAIFGGTLPQPHPLSAEIANGGDLYVVLDCPQCHVTVKVKTEVDVEFKVRGREGFAQIKPVFKAKARTHTCGQQELPMDETPVDGQTEAFPARAAAPEPEPELDPEARLALEDDVVRLLDRLEREEFEVGETAAVPPEEEIRGWATADLRLAYEWAWAVIHAEPEQPPVPAVLRRDPEPEVEAAAAEAAPPDFGLDETACSHEGRGLPGCPVCDPEGVRERDAAEGTGDPDGALLP